MTALPPEIDPDDEIEVTWESDELSTKVVATLGEASITVECSPDGAHTIPWLIAAMPSILEAAYAAQEAEENQEEAREQSAE